MYKHTLSKNILSERRSKFHKNSPSIFILVLGKGLISKANGWMSFTKVLLLEMGLNKDNNYKKGFADRSTNQSVFGFGMYNLTDVLLFDLCVFNIVVWLRN